MKLNWAKDDRKKFVVYFVITNPGFSGPGFKEHKVEEFQHKTATISFLGFKAPANPNVVLFLIQKLFKIKVQVCA
jgi:hypothetical protein